jgi:hypothetical protein
LEALYDSTRRDVLREGSGKEDVTNSKVEPASEVNQKPEKYGKTSALVLGLEMIH